MKPYRHHYKELTRLGLPIVIGQLGIIFVSFVDTFMVSRHGTNDLAAASFVNNMFNLAIIFATGFSYGLTPIIGKLFGKGKKEEAGGMFKNALFANGTMAMLLTAAMWILYLNIGNLGQPAELLGLIRPYYITLLLSIPFTLLFNAFKQFADGITDTKTPMWILLTGNVLNIAGNYMLIFGKCGLPELGLLGAGVSTLASRMAMLAISLVIFFRSNRLRAYAYGFLKTGIARVRQKELYLLGLPVAAQMGMETASFSLATIMVGWIGATALAAHQIMCTVGQLGFMLYYGMGAAVAVKTSNYNGMGDTINIRRTANAGFHLITVMAIITSVIVFTLRNHIGGVPPHHLFGSNHICRDIHAARQPWHTVHRRHHRDITCGTACHTVCPLPVRRRNAVQLCQRPAWHCLLLYAEFYRKSLALYPGGAVAFEQVLHFPSLQRKAGAAL